MSNNKFSEHPCSLNGLADEPLTLLVRRTAAQLRPWVLEAQVALTSADVFPRGERLDLARMDARRTRRMELTKRTTWIEDKHPCSLNGLADEPLTLLVRRTAAQLRPWVLEAQVALASADVFPRGERLDLARMDARRTRRMELTKHTAWIEDKHPCLAAHPPTRYADKPTAIPRRHRRLLSVGWMQPIYQCRAAIEPTNYANLRHKR